MKNVLKKIGLIDTLTITLSISKMDFVNRLYNNTDPGSTDMFSASFEVFSSSKNEFKGQVNLNGFILRRRSRFFDTNGNFATANGSFTEEQGQLTIHTEINGFKTFFFFYYGFLIIFYSLFFWGIARGNGINLVAIPFLILHAILMFGLPYFFMKRSVKRLIYDLEREFYYLTKDNDRL